MDKPYSNKSDIWSLGCVLYEAINLRPPFKSESMEGLFKKVLNGLYPAPPKNYSKHICNIVS
jgi:serine/threonine protein kinase